jgi:hypothetical protein
MGRRQLYDLDRDISSRGPWLRGRFHGLPHGQDDPGDSHLGRLIGEGSQVQVAGVFCLFDPDEPAANQLQGGQEDSHHDQTVGPGLKEPPEGEGAFALEAIW